MKGKAQTEILCVNLKEFFHFNAIFQPLKKNIIPIKIRYNFFT